MFREMRRFKQAMSQDECEAVLGRRKSGVLALSGDGDYPYAVPLSYAFSDGKIYFHCATRGYKLDCIKICDKASFCVIDHDEIQPQKVTTYYRSVIAFGRVRVLEDEAEKRRAVELLSAKLLPNTEPKCLSESLNRLLTLELRIEHMTGKESMVFKQ